MNHTPEPLEVHDGFSDQPTLCKMHEDGRTCHIVAELGVTEGQNGKQAQADANRLALCYNTLAGIPTEVIESGAIGTLVKTLMYAPVAAARSAG